MTIRENWERLFHRIVLQAIDDYIFSRDFLAKNTARYKRLMASDKVKTSAERDFITTYRLSQWLQADTKAFFSGDYCKDLCGIDGTVIYENIKDMSRRELKKRIGGTME